MAKFKKNGKLKLLIIVGTRPEIIRLAAVINKCRQYFDCLLAHTGQNYDYNLNGVFFKDLKLADPDIYMEAVGADLGETMGNIIAKSYQLMVEVKPDAVLVLGDTNSCLSVIGAKRLHIPIFHMEAGNRCKDENMHVAISPIQACPKSVPTSQVLRWPKCSTITWPRSKPAIFTSVLDWKRENTSCSLLTEKRTSTPRRTSSPSSMPSTKWQRSTICLSSTAAIPVHANVLKAQDSSSIVESFSTSLLASTTITVSR